MMKLLLKDGCGEITEKEYSHKGQDGGVVSFLESKLHRYMKTEDEITSVLDAVLPYFTIDAVKKNKIMTIEELLKFDKTLLQSKNYEDFTLFHAIPMNYHKKKLSTLAAKFEDKSQLLKLLQQKTVFGVSPLDYAIKLKNSTAIEDFLKLGAHYDQSTIGLNTVSDILE